MSTLAQELRALMADRKVSQRALSRRTYEGTEDGSGLPQGTISLILQGRTRTPNDATLRLIAAGLAETKDDRDHILRHLRESAGRTAEEPRALTWPAEVDRLSDSQRRRLQQVVRLVVGAMLDEDTTDADAPVLVDFDHTAGAPEVDPPEQREPPASKRVRQRKA